MPNPFADAAREAVAAATGVPAAELKVDAPPRPELGDFAVGLFPAAKRLGKAPPAIAAEVAKAFTPGEHLVTAVATGPFVNFTVNRAAAFRWAITHAIAGDLVPRQYGAGKAITVDYSSPNISKHLAFHHIRSTSLGHSIAQIHRALGFRVVGINHLGDWGTTHGMVIAACKKWGTPDPLDVTALNELYVKFNQAMKTDASLIEDARTWSRKLEDGDPEARALWQRFRDVSWAELQSIYDMMGIKFEEVRGESAYLDDVPRIMAEFAPFITESEGALVVQLPDEKTPLLLRTRDGTSLYGTRDLATAEYRWSTYQFARSLYIVDRGQSLHFRQVFKALELAGHAWAKHCEHIPFGLVLMAGKKGATRAGDAIILLKDVFHAASQAVRPLIRENLPQADEATVDQIARDVGVGAVVFANLVTQRDKDVHFELERATSVTGDSGVYVQYNHARCVSLQNKGGGLVTVTDAHAAPFERLVHPLEWAVARRLFDFGDHVVRAADACEPHVIAHYALDLASDFARYYTAGNDDKSLRIVCEDPDLQRARLALTAAVHATLRESLTLLGMAAPDAL